MNGFHNDKQVASSEKHAKFKTIVQKNRPYNDQNGLNRYPIYDQRG